MGAVIFCPTLIRARRPDYVTMCEETFGPVKTIVVESRPRKVRDSLTGALLKRHSV